MVSLASGASDPWQHIAARGKWRDAAAYALFLAGVVAYTAQVGGISLARDARFATTTFDLGIYDQAVWLIRHGEPLFLSTRGLHVFGDHFAPILCLLAPLYCMWESPRCLLAAQTLGLAIGAWPVYEIARIHVRSRGTALFFAVAYLLNPAIGWMNAFDFHPEALATPILLFGLWACEARRPRPLLMAMVLLLLCKETMGITVAMVGVYCLRQLGRRQGLQLIGLGAAGLALSLIVMRYMNAGQSSAYFSLYAPHASSATAAVVFLVTHPGRVVAALLSATTGLYLLALAAPVAFVCLMGPRALLIAAPALAINVLSSRSAMQTIYYHYTAVIVPVLFLAAIQGAGSALRRWERPGRRWPRSLLEAGLAVACAWGFSVGPMPPANEGQHHAPGLDRLQTAAAEEAIRKVPPDASVSAQTAIAAKLAHRTTVYMYPNPFWEACWGNSAAALQQQEGRSLVIGDLAASLGRIQRRRARAEYVLLAPGSRRFPISGGHYRAFVRPILLSPDYGVIWARDNVAVLRCGADHAGGLRRLRSEQANCFQLAALCETRHAEIPDEAARMRRAVADVSKAE